ncbi:MAG: DUF2520 domain-containing protein [Flavobacteriales bacterium]|nr:DUF2520 domain-containing protein [Flavobacteriales bacterium]MCW8913507.1 DUF2520 domain-containing protein [Flavobacteriales bacterium]MCW8937340.1 DUF2520 domain-containing protein [Flavobacteriales bacterium]MCW8940012.1 DUF2520 domain-containing protein [Flavobacteriales bacterium]MCW8968169.1 DUF2520 domain-containing protein [Flavobacteriales bacterium]
MKPIKRISIIGSGNVAISVSKAIVNKGLTLVQVVGRKIENVQALLAKLNSEQLIEAVTDFNRLNKEVDCFIVCVNDDAIVSVLKDFPFKDKLVVHTSGSVGLSVFSGFEKYGVFYPLQTFSKENPIAFDEVPLCIEGSSKEVFDELIELGKTLSNKVVELNSQQREVLHLAAVFACNFSNYMYQVADELTTKNKIDFSILLPLINETANKINKQSPKEAQTGPAKRNDQQTIDKHLAMLEDNTNKELYKLITKLIQQ